MKFGIYYAYWEKTWDAGFDNYMKHIKKVSALGFDILELSCAPIPSFSDARLGELRSAAADCGVELTAGYGPAPSQNIASEDPAVVKNAEAFFAGLFKKLQKMDVRLVGGGLYSYWPVDYGKPFDKAADRERSVRGMRALSHMAEACGLTLCMEVLNRFEGYMLNTAKEGAAYVDEVGRPNVKLMLDTFHMNIEEDGMEDAIYTAGGRLGHFHIGERNRRVPGKGGMPWTEIGRALGNIGYGGAAVMEPFVMPGGARRKRHQSLARAGGGYVRGRPRPGRGKVPCVYQKRLRRLNTGAQTQARPRAANLGCGTAGNPACRCQRRRLRLFLNGRTGRNPVRPCFFPPRNRIAPGRKGAVYTSAGGFSAFMRRWAYSCGFRCQIPSTMAR